MNIELDYITPNHTRFILAINLIREIVKLYTKKSFKILSRIKGIQIKFLSTESRQHYLK